MFLKKITLVAMPLAGVFYFIVGVIFDLPWMVYVLGAILGIILYCGILVVVSSRYDGKIVVTSGEDGKRIFTLELEIDPDDIIELESITFQVINELEIRNINIPYNGD